MKQILYTDVYSPSREELDTHYLRAPGSLKAPLSLPAIGHEEPEFLSIELPPPRPKRPAPAAVVKPGRSSLF